MSRLQIDIQKYEKKSNIGKFRYSVKATKIFLALLSSVKNFGRLFQILVVFSEYLNF